MPERVLSHREQCSKMRRIPNARPVAPEPCNSALLKHFLRIRGSGSHALQDFARRAGKVRTQSGADDTG